MYNTHIFSEPIRPIKIKIMCGFIFNTFHSTGYYEVRFDLLQFYLILSKENNEKKNLIVIITNCP